jgi:integrase
MTPLRQALDDYLRIRRQLGFDLTGPERQLNDFVGFLERSGAERITTELALRWAQLPVDAHPHWCKRRLGVVRGFARYLATVDPDSDVPPQRLLVARRPRVAPYIYSPAEVTALMRAAALLTPPSRAATFQTVIGLIATTGLRAGEALALDRHDVDLADGAVHVRARQHKQREVPLHRTATTALQQYARVRDRHQPAPESPAFFLNTRRGRLSKAEFNRQFAKLIGQIGLEGAGERARPRPHDLRHTMAVRTLLDWRHAEENVDRRMPELSTFLGHSDPASTYYYLQAVPELMATVSVRLEQFGEVLA